MKKNNRRVNRDKISQFIRLTNRRNIVEIHDFLRDFSEESRFIVDCIPDFQIVTISCQKCADFYDMGSHQFDHDKDRFIDIDEISKIFRLFCLSNEKFTFKSSIRLWKLFRAKKWKYPRNIWTKASFQGKSEEECFCIDMEIFS